MVGSTEGREEVVNHQLTAHTAHVYSTCVACVCVCVCVCLRAHVCVCTNAIDE